MSDAVHQQLNQLVSDSIQSLVLVPLSSLVLRTAQDNNNDDEDYVSKLTMQLLEDMIGHKKTPVADCLFRTTDVVPLLTQSLKDRIDGKDFMVESANQT